MEKKRFRFNETCECLIFKSGQRICLNKIEFFFKVISDNPVQCLENTEMF